MGDSLFPLKPGNIRSVMFLVNYFTMSLITMCMFMAPGCTDDGVFRFRNHNIVLNLTIALFILMLWDRFMVCIWVKIRSECTYFLYERTCDSFTDKYLL